MVYTKQESDTILGTLDKGLHVLVVLSEARGAGLTLTELCTQVGLHRTTMFRILATLQTRGFVTRDEQTGSDYRPTVDPPPIILARTSGPAWPPPAASVPNPGATDARPKARSFEDQW